MSHEWKREIPSPPIGLKVDSVNSTSISISWQPPYDAKCIITEYQVSYTMHGGSEQLLKVQDTTSTDLISLEPHTEYTIRVRAKEVDFGDYSNPITIHTLETENVSAILNNSKHIRFKQLRMIKLIFYGTPRAGKTTLRKQLLRVVEGVGLQPRDSNIEPSTNIADSIFVERIVMTNEGSNELKWTRQKLDDIAKSLMQCLGNTKLHCDTESNDLPEESLDEYMIENHDVQQNSSLESQHSVGSRDLGADSPPMQVVTEETRKQFHPSIETNEYKKVHIDIKELFRNAIKTGKWKEVVEALNFDEATFLQIIDVGGQPSFQDIFPLLISGPSLTVLVFKLTDDLKALHPVPYQPESQHEGQKAWQDTYVVKDIFSHALASFAVSQKHTLLPFPHKILLIGTHKDKLEVSQDPAVDKERNKKAQIESIAMKLYGWLHPSKAFESIQVQNMEDLIIRIDNFSQHDIVLVKKKIEELILQIESQDVPASWMVFDFVLHKFAEMEKLCKIGTSDCKDIAHVCGITENINGVLHYLHYEAGTLLYYSDIPGLNEYVITDFQLIFDSISNIIIHYFQNSISGPDLKHRIFFKQKGLFDASVLRDVEGCLKVHELISLLHHRHIISKMEGTNMYFMPSVLPKDRLSCNLSDKSLCYLVLFDHDYCPVGLFCATTIKLIASHKWKLNESTPQFRNKIDFYCTCSGKSYNVIFSEFSAHYEVCLMGDALPEVKYKVYQDMNDVISTVCKDMKYLSPTYGFYCPKKCMYENGSYVHDPHPATCAFNDESQEMKCYYSGTPSDLSEEHKQWFKQEQKMSHKQKRDAKGVNEIILCDDNHTQIFHMTKKACSEWRGIGVRLGFTGNELSAIVREPGRTHEEHYYSAMLMRWLDWAPPNHHRPSVQRLSSALREVGYEGLAFDLDVQYHESDNYSIPDPPIEVTAQPTSSKSIKVSWTLPQNISKRGAIQGYELSYSTSKSSTSVLNVGVTTFDEITGLKPYTTYNISVRTRAAGAYSEYSSPCTATTKEDVPSAPIAIVADGITATSMTLSWQPPQNANGIIRNYQVSYTPHDGSECIHDMAGDITSTELTSLKPHTKYTIRVRAKTVEFGEYSSVITKTTLLDDVQTEISSLSANYQSCTLKELRIEKLIFYGTPRAGKTKLRKALLGDADACKLSSTPQPSTNIAEMCGQVIVERILASKGEKNDDELKWTVVQLGDMGNTLLKCMYSEKVRPHLRDPKPSHSMPRGQENVNEQYSLSHSDSALNSSPTQVADTVQELSQITSVVNHVEGKILAISPTIQESHPSLSIDVKRLIREAAKTDEWSKVLSALHIPDKPMLLIQVIDGGGQPSFQEIFPLFISGPSVTLFIFKLTDDLENPVPVEYQPKDNAGKHKWNDKYVVKEYIFHALSSLASSARDATDKVKNNQLRPQVLLVGTYRDELPGSEVDKKAAVERCNGSIVAWVRQTKTFHQAIDVSNNKDTFVTDISNLEPNDIRNIKKKIEDKMLERELQSIPARLLVFDFILHNHAVTQNIRKVEKKEYEEIALLCGIESKKIDETLNYLHQKVGTLLYYPNIPELKQCVIVDFQLIFDSVSNIIVKHFANTEVQTLPHDKGQFEVSVLKEIKYCLSIEELIALLKHRQVISPLGDDKFFMPSVLTKKETEPADASSCYFLLLFEHGTCPVGLFCAVTSKLITSTSSSPRWELKKTEQFRNKITFQVSLHGRWPTVVFSAFSAHYEVKLLEKDSPSEIKFTIYTTINKLISNICSDLGFSSPLYGFYCPGKCEYDGTNHDPYEHPAQCIFNSESTQMRCHYTNSCHQLSPEQKMWFTEVHSEDQRRGFLECSKKDIYKIAGYDFDWRRVGRRLLCDQKVQDIDHEGGSEGEKKEKMLLEWKRTKSRDATYQALVKGLRAIENNATADQVEELLERKSKRQRVK